jgi:2-polyprenyl-3-methyl-5-hydroxy-6-metoxy-1,4-benzoquinol methylase
LFLKDGNSEMANIARLEQIASHQHMGFEVCPVCGQNGAREWLRAPDRMHGRQQIYTLARCPSCTLVWLSHPPTPQEMSEHYTPEYHRLISGAGETSPLRWSKHKEELRPYKQAGALLDLGCSSGAFLQSLREEPWELFGIEMSSECAQRAEARSGAKVYVGDILEAPFAPGSFDVITCFDVLEHLYEPRKVMSKVKTWLKPNGIFYVFVPNVDSAEARVFGRYWCGLELPRHLFHYSPTSLRYLAKSVGLHEVALVTTRNPSVGNGIRYFFDDVFRTFGISRTPLAYRGDASLPWKIVRKIVRLSVLRVLLTMAPLAGEGEAIHAVFQNTSDSGVELQ